jgi:hypothetical protein
MELLKSVMSARAPLSLAIKAPLWGGKLQAWNCCDFHIWLQCHPQEESCTDHAKRVRRGAFCQMFDIDEADENQTSAYLVSAIQIQCVLHDEEGIMLGST